MPQKGGKVGRRRAEQKDWEGVEEGGKCTREKERVGGEKGERKSKRGERKGGACGESARASEEGWKGSDREEGWKDRKEERCVCVYLCVCVHACVCVPQTSWERVIERKGGEERGRRGERGGG